MLTCFVEDSSFYLVNVTPFNKMSLALVLSVCFKVEKTRHYLLLREKLEATLQAGQEALYKSGDISDFAKSPVLSHSPGSNPPTPDSPNQRQRELAAKVTAGVFASIWVLVYVVF